MSVGTRRQATSYRGMLGLWFLLLVVVAHATVVAEEEPPRYALVVGVPRCPFLKDVGLAARPLPYAIADARAMAEALIKYRGFRKQNVKLLLDEQATHSAIRDSIMSWLGDKTRATPEALVVIFFAGHGTMGADKLDPNGLTDEEDGYDEYLLPYDAGRVPARRSFWDSLVCDDEFAFWLGHLDSRKIVVVLDSCHSGDMARAIVRGILPLDAGRAILVTDGFTRDLVLRSNRQTDGTAGLIILSACKADEDSHEDPALGHGVFTYYIVEALTTLATSISVERLFSYAKTSILGHEPRWPQTPTMDGSYSGEVYLPYEVLPELSPVRDAENDRSKDEPDQRQRREPGPPPIGFP